MISKTNAVFEVCFMLELKGLPIPIGIVLVFIQSLSNTASARNVFLKQWVMKTTAYSYLTRRIFWFFNFFSFHYLIIISVSVSKILKTNQLLTRQNTMSLKTSKENLHLNPHNLKKLSHRAQIIRTTPLYYKKTHLFLRFHFANDLGYCFSQNLLTSISSHLL